MQNMLRYAVLAVTLVTPSIAGAASSAQQERMRACNAQAKDKNLSGAERKQFMSDCLAGREAAAAPSGRSRQQERMKSCNRDAADKKLAGEERKKFMSECLRA